MRNLSTQPDRGIPEGEAPRAAASVVPPSLTEMGGVLSGVGAAPARPRKRSRNLAYELVEDIADRIRRQVLKPGDKLPTEMAIMESYGVSRTVVRDAVSRLQAAGLVETHHGVGTFVLEVREGTSFRVEPTDIASSIDVLAALELRTSIETETAGLAAMRRTDAHLAQMRAALDEFEANVSVAGDTVSPDFRFHLAIAEATGNRYFTDIMSHLGATLIPRTRVNSSRLPDDHLPRYLSMVNREHEEIYEAIARRDPESARAAMRIHLSKSRERQMRAQDAARQAAGAAASVVQPDKPL